MDEEEKEIFNEYIEINIIKEALESENQFKLGFKTGVKLMMECTEE